MSKRPVISLIWAMSRNQVIGLDNRLPWHLPADLKHFKQLTLGKPIIMGRRTWESLPGILPGRQHIVLTRDKAYRAAGCCVVTSIDQALSSVGDAGEVMVVGGAELYREMLPLSDWLYLTLVHVEVEGDTCFPPLDWSEWQEVSREDHFADAANLHDYSFISYRRKNFRSE